MVLLEVNWLKRCLDRIENSVDPNQTAPRSSLISGYTVCPDLSVRKLRNITVPILLPFI